MPVFVVWQSLTCPARLVGPDPWVSVTVTGAANGPSMAKFLNPARTLNTPGWAFTGMKSALKFLSALVHLIVPSS